MKLIASRSSRRFALLLEHAEEVLPEGYNQRVSAQIPQFFSHRRQNAEFLLIFTPKEVGVGGSLDGLSAAYTAQSPEYRIVKQKATQAARVGTNSTIT